MDWLQFTAAVIGHVAWPLVMIVLLVVLRKQVGALAERIEEFSFGGAKFTWEKTLKEGREIVDQLPAQLSETLEVPQPTLPHIGAADIGESCLESPAPKGPHNEDNRVFHKRRKMRSKSNALFRATTIGAIHSSYDEVEEILQDIGELLGVPGPQARSVIYVLKTEGWISEEIADLFNKISVGRNLVMNQAAAPSNRDAKDYMIQANILKDAFSVVRTQLRKQATSPKDD